MRNKIVQHERLTACNETPAPNHWFIVLPKKNLQVVKLPKTRRLSAIMRQKLETKVIRLFILALRFLIFFGNWRRKIYVYIFGHPGLNNTVRAYCSTFPMQHSFFSELFLLSKDQQSVCRTSYKLVFRENSSKNGKNSQKDGRERCPKRNNNHGKQQKPI